MLKQKPADGHTIPDESGTPKNHCFACGKDNPDGMHLKFYIDEAARRTVCEFELSQRYQGPPGHAHGGIIATILDEAMGKVNKFRNVVALTKKMEVEYLKPVPLGKSLKVTGHEQEVIGRQHINVAEICNEKGEVLARSTGTFIAVDINKVFARLMKSEDGLADPQQK
ncbi:MAG TPA: PaaI family thioesterase [Candidatus Angelobacter sp.]